MFDHLQLDAVPGSRFFRRFACVTLIHVSQLDILLRDLLHLPGQFLHLGSILLVGRRDMQGQQMAQRVNCRMDLRSFAPFGSVISGPRTDSGVDCSVRLSRTMAVGWAFRPENSRSSMRRSSTMVSKHRARIQRCVC